MREYHNFINGESVTSRTDQRVQVTNPSTGEIIATVPETGAEEVGSAIAAAAFAQPGWAKLPAVRRAQYLHDIATMIRGEVEGLARLITEEQGKVLSLSRTEVNFTADYMDYMAEWARRIEGEIVESDRPNETIFLFRQPIGVIAGILPWNFPFFLIARKVAPALVCGNAIVIKPSEETPCNAHEFCKFVERSGLPKGVFNLVSGRGATTGHALASSDKVGMVSFTGSVETGARVMATASKNITKVNLELGGKAPALVLADADIALAARAIRDSRILNTGQVCNAAERIYVEERVRDEFVERLIGEMRRTKYGDPLRQPDVEMGPLINQAGFDKVDSMVKEAVAGGAEAVIGARRGQGAGGFFYEPTVLLNCRQDMPIMRREIFGPVAPIATFSDLDEAIALANDCEYGLTSSIYTTDIRTAMRACKEIRFGETYINRENFEAMQGFHAGCRKSGIGGADGKHGLYEYLQTHVVYMQH